MPVWPCSSAFGWWYPASSLLSHFTDAAARARAEGRPLPHPDACAMTGIILGILIGVIPITAVMLVSPTHTNILLWQLIPLYLSAIQLAVVPFFLHKLNSAQELRLPHRKIHMVAQLLFILCALLATPSHITFLRTMLSSQTPGKGLIDAFLPYPFEYKYRTSQELITLGPKNEVERFIQWDVLFMFVSTWLAGVWFWAFSSIRSLLLALLPITVSAFVLGPGALFVAPFMVQAKLDE